MKVGLALPSFVDDPEIPITVARAADRAGLDGVFVYDHLWRGEPRRPALECCALLGAVAAETSRIAVGTLVARATLRPPATLVAALDTVQRVSSGRLIAAIGAGDSESRAENEAFGLEFGTIGARVDVLHDAVRAARGRGFPVWVGGTLSSVRELTAIADGWNAWGLTPEQFAAEAELVRAVAPAATLTWGGLVLVGRSDDAAAAKARSRSMGAHVLSGGVERVAEGVRAYGAAGAEWVILGPLDSSDPENADLLAEVRAAL